MLFTNAPFRGHKSISELFRTLRDASSSGATLSIAVGYVSVGELISLGEEASSLVGNIQILDGMARTRPLSSAYFDAIQELRSSIRHFEFYVPKADSKPYHGKLFVLETGSGSEVYVGSANFSLNAIEAQYELVVPAPKEAFASLKQYRDWLFSEQYAMPLHQGEVAPQPLPEPALPSVIDQVAFVVRLRPDEKPKSGLNAFLGKPREGEGVRNWYEVELSLTEEERGQLGLPATDEFFFVRDPRTGDEVKCRRSGDNGKEIRSVGNLRLLGALVKGILGLRRDDFLTGDTPKRAISQSDLGSVNALGFVLRGTRSGLKIYDVVPMEA